MDTQGSQPRENDSQLDFTPGFSTFSGSKFLPWKVTSVSWFMGMTEGLGARNWGQLSSCERAKLVRRSVSYQL